MISISSRRHGGEGRHLNVPAIKALRQLTGLGLKDAKDAIEELHEKGSSFSLQFELRTDLNAVDEADAIVHLRDAGFEVTAKLGFRESFHKLACRALEERNYALTRDLLDLIDRYC